MSFKRLEQLNRKFADLKDINLIYAGDVVLIPNKRCE
nr:hypothetical protein [Vibrio kanaloae]